MTRYTVICGIGKMCIVWHVINDKVYIMTRVAVCDL